MKIAVAGTRGIPSIQGGVEMHCEQLYPRLVSLGCDVVLFRRSCYVKDQLSEYKGVRLKNLYAPRKKSLEAIVHTFLSVIHAKRMKADILHIHAVGPSLLVPFAKFLGLKVVMTHHGPDYDRRKWNWLARYVLRFGEKKGVRNADAVIVISRVIDQLIRDRYNRTDARLIRNGVNIPEKSFSTEYIESLGLSKGNYILAVGRFVPEKGFDLLLSLIPLLREKNIQLVLAGDADHETEYSQELKKEAVRQGAVLPGFITGDRLNEVFSHARLFLLPSYHEGLPIALLEAMSYGLDVLISDIPANKEVGLSSSCYFSTGNIEDLSQQLKAKIAIPSRNVVYDMSVYDWDKIAREVLDLYHEI